MMDRYATYGNSTPNPWIKRGIAAAVLVVFVGLLVYATTDGTQMAEDATPPLVNAPQIAIKERPENPGGMEIPNRDKEVFDLLEVTTDGGVPTPSQAQVDAAQVPAVAATAGAVAAAAVVAPTQAPQPAPQVAQVPAKPVVVEQPKPAPVAQAKPTAAPAPVAKPANGKWAVQLGSFRKKDDADKAAKLYQTKFSGLLKGLNAQVKSASLGDKGTVYRVYFGGLASQDAARTLCNKFKAQNQGCLTAQL